MSSISKNLTAPPNGYSNTLSGSINSSALTINFNDSVATLPAEGVGVIFKKDADNEPISTSIEFIHWTGASGTQLTLTNTGDRGIAGSYGAAAQSHDSNDYFEVWVGNQYYESLRTGFVVEHNQDGTHAETALDSMIAGTEAQGDIIYHNGTIWTRLAAGTSGQFLKTQGASANPTWADASATDGWIADSNTYVYVSASSFKITGTDLTTRFTKGTRIKFTQTTAKYFVVVSSSFSTDTTVTVAVNTDYTIANAAITSPYYSYQLSPAGYPNWFTFSPTFGGFSVNPSGGMGMKYRIEGNTCYFKMHYTSDGTSNATTFTITIPVAAAQALYVVGQGFAKDGGSNVTPTYGHLETTASSATVDVRKTLYQGSWTGSGAKNFWMGEPAVVEF